MAKTLSEEAWFLVLTLDKVGKRLDEKFIVVRYSDADKLLEEVRAMRNLVYDTIRLLRQRHDGKSLRELRGASQAPPVSE